MKGLEKYENTVRHINKVIYSVKRLAIREGWPYDLSFNVHRDLILSNCFYCGREPYTIALPSLVCNGKIPVNGIDRIDNTKGYTADNCVSCCIECNRMKRDNTAEQFIKLCRTIANKHTLPLYR